MPRKLEIFKEVRALKLERKKLTKLVALLDAHYVPQNTGALSLAFVTHERLAELHGEFCDDGSPTDVITFPGVDGDFGEICVSPQAAVEYVRKKGGKAEEELKRYVIHGYLHLLGYDDLKPKLKVKMRREEKRSLELTKTVRGVFTFSKRA